MIRKISAFLWLITWCFVATAQSFIPLSESFEGDFPPQGWTSLHTDGLTYWEQTSSTTYCNGAYNGSHFVMIGAGQGDNYLITPKLHPQAGDSVVFYMGIESAGYNLNNLTTVEISTTGNAPENFTAIRTLTVADFTSANTWHRFALSLSAYEGQNIYLAFHNIVSPESMFGGGEIYLDYINGPTAEIPACTPPTALTSSNITGTSADLSWTSDAPEHIVYLRAAGETDYTAYPNATLDSVLHVFQLTELTENVTYQWYVAAICNDTLNSPVATFRTTSCHSLTSDDLPYFTTFDNLENLGDLPECWTRIEEVEFSPGTDVFFPGAFSASYLYAPWITGDTTLYFINQNGGRCWVSMPAVDVEVHQLRLRFSAKPYTNSAEYGRLEIGLLEDLADTSNFEIVQTIEAANLPSNNFIPYTISFGNTGISGPNRYICFRTIGQSESTWHVDNLTLEAIPACNEPSGLAVNEVTATTASLSWIPGDDSQIQFFIHYRPLGDTAWQELEVFIFDSAFTELEGLRHSTTYEAYVTAPCAPQQSNLVTFTTGCLPIETENLPYQMNFENTATYELPLCWTLLQGHNEYGHTYPCTHEGTTAYEGNHCLRFFANATDSNIVALPPIGENIQQLRIKFWLKPGGNMTPYGCMEIGLMSDLEDPSSFEVVRTITASQLSTSDYQFYKIPFHTATMSGADRYIVFRCINSMNTTSGYAWYLDNLVVEHAPDCAEPENLTVTEVSPSSVGLTWTLDSPSPTPCTLYYRELGDTVWTAQSVDSALSTTIVNLSPSTTYAAFIAADCAPDQFSLPLYFTTDCPGITAAELPKVWDFENDNPAGTQTRPLPSCWKRATLANGNAPYVLTDAAQAYQGTKALYFSNVEGYAILPPIDENLDLNTLQLSFMVRSSHIGYIDYTSRFEVGVMSNPLDINTFHAIRTFSISGGTYTPVEVSFANYSGEGKYMAIRQLEGTDLEANGYIDMVMIDTISDCERPYDLHEEILSESATRLIWSSSAAEFTVYYKSEGDDYYTQISDITDTFVVISSLFVGYNCQWYVTANCSDTVLASLPRTFSTPCNEIPYIIPLSPFEQGFDLTTIPLEVPRCWVRLSSFMLNASEIYPAVDTIYERHSWNLLMAGFEGSNLISMPIYSQHLDHYRLYFSAKAATTESNNLEVGVMDYLSPDAEFHVIASLKAQDYLAELNASTPYIPFVMDMDTAAFHSGWLVLRLVCDDNILSQWHLDDFKVATLSDCSEPLYLSVSNITSNSVDLSWESSADTFDLFYGSVNEEYLHRINGITRTDGVYTLSGLSGGTHYIWYVIAHCPDNELSGLSQEGEFFTDCGVVNLLPYFEGFEYDMGCWDSEIIDGSNNWMIFNNSQYAHSGDNCVIFLYNTDNSARLISPVFDLSGYENVRLGYALYLHSYNDHYDSVGVYYRTSATTPWTYLCSHTDNMGVNNYISHNIPLPNTNSEYQVMFLGEGLGGNSIFLDNIWVTGTIHDDTDTTSTDDGIVNHLSDNLILYPNPANHFVEIRVDGNGITIEGMEVYDIYGKLIRTTGCTNNVSPIHINVSDLSSGVYFVRVRTNRGVVTKRFVKQ